jgi:hypothetical protein
MSVGKRALFFFFFLLSKAVAAAHVYCMYICEDILQIEQDVYYHKYVMMITMMMVMLEDGLYRS